MPEPGWYEDPTGNALRWWDGSAWTDHVSTREALAGEKTTKRSTRVLRCDNCFRRRDPRVTFCPWCGAFVRTETAEEVPAGGFHADSRHTILHAGRMPLLPEGLSTQRSIALKQELAILHGDEPASVATLREQALEDQHLAMSKVSSDLSQRMATGSGSSGQWEANSFGLSGRVIRGYRHWRHKR